jgi:hypothetical protein
VRDPNLEKLERLRRSVLERTPPPDAELERYLEKVRRRAYSITDQEVAALLASGHDQDQIFEHTVGAALGAAVDRFDAGVRALEGVKKR